MVNRLFSWEKQMAYATKKQDIAKAVESLIELISDISEEYYLASWSVAIEEEVWAAMQGKDSDIPIELLDKCRELSEKINGWVYWKEDKFCPEYISLEEWESILNA